jgi:hypothetical protein
MAEEEEEEEKKSKQSRSREKLGLDVLSTGRPGTVVVILKMFSAKKNWQKVGVFDSK